MISDYVIQNRLGIHVMPAKRIAAAAEAFECDIKLSTQNKTANPKEMIQILKLGLKQGDKVFLETSGQDEHKAQKIIGEMLVSL